MRGRRRSLSRMQRKRRSQRRPSGGRPEAGPSGITTREASIQPTRLWWQPMKRRRRLQLPIPSPPRPRSKRLLVAPTMAARVVAAEERGRARAPSQPCSSRPRPRGCGRRPSGSCRGRGTRSRSTRTGASTTGGSASTRRRPCGPSMRGWARRKMFPRHRPRPIPGADAAAAARKWADRTGMAPMPRPSSVW